MQTIFISYSSRNWPWVEQLCQKLASPTRQLWYDRAEILPGHNIFDDIYSAIRKSNVLIVILSKQSVKSPWVKEETEFAKLRQFEASGLNIIPVLLEDCEIPPHLRTLHYCDCRGEFQNGVRQLVAALDDCAMRASPPIDHGAFTDFLVALGKLQDINNSVSRLMQMRKLFVPPKQLSQMEKLLDDTHCVFIVGDPHTGKTYTALHLLWKLYTNGYFPVWLNYDVLAHKFRTQQYDMDMLASEYLKPKHAVYIEDPFGGVSSNEIVAFNRGLRSFVSELKHRDVRVVITSRD